METTGVSHPHPLSGGIPRGQAPGMWPRFPYGELLGRVRRWQADSWDPG